MTSRRNGLREVEIDGGARDVRGGTPALSDPRAKLFGGFTPAVCPSTTTGVNRTPFSWHREAASWNLRRV